MFNWAVATGLADHNPAIGVKYINTGSQGFNTWSVSEIEQFEAHWEVATRPRLALSLLLYTGVRKSDLVRLGSQFETMIGGVEYLSFTEHKGRNRKPKQTTIPILPQLRRIIDASETGAMIYLVGERGRPYTSETAGNMFRRWSREAGITDKSAHGMRKAAETILAERGATAPQICSVFGWTKLSTAETYIRKANRTVMAASGLNLMDRGQGVNKIVPLKDRK